jgi:hypothetical protein
MKVRALNCAGIIFAATAVFLGSVTAVHSQRVDFNYDMRKHLFENKLFDGKWVGENETLELVVRLKFVFPDPWDGSFLVGNMRVKNKVLGTTRVYSLGKAEAQELYRENGLYWVERVWGVAQGEKEGDQFARLGFALDVQSETLQLVSTPNDDFWRCKRGPSRESPLTMTRE